MLVVGWRGAVLFTTHDRRLLERVATRIVELERGRLSSWPGDYANYLRRREERQAAEAREIERFEKKLAEEERWIRQGIQARRTRNEGRVRQLEKMRDVRAQRRKNIGRASFKTQSSAASGKRVFETRSLRFGFGQQLLIDDLNTFIARGDRVGIIGPNGSGKTSLLRLLVGELAPTSGEVIVGARVDIAYFDQHRSRLDESATVADNVADGAEHISVGDGTRHIISYLQDFLFTPARARSPVTVLSGGERARLLLARLFAKSSNVLVMDEPTNDLDVETLELLEERLIDYPGSLLLVSHDRAFLDNVVTSTLVLEANGRVGEYVGGYSDWVRQRATLEEAAKPPNRPANAEARPGSSSGVQVAAGQGSKSSTKIGYKERRELESLPGRIEALEAELAQLQAQLADPGFYKKAGSEVAGTRASLARVQSELETSYKRWTELEALV